MMKSEIKCFNKSKSFEFMVINNDKVHSIGIDWKGKLGLGNVHVSHGLTEIPELSNKCIEEFYAGKNCRFVRSKKNDIYYWGCGHPGKSLALKELNQKKMSFSSRKTSSK